MRKHLPWLITLMVLVATQAWVATLIDPNQLPLTFRPSNVNNIIFVDGVKYPQTLSGIQSALNAASAGQKVVIPGPFTYSGAGNVLTIPAGLDVECQGQPTLSFSGVSSSTDLITIGASFPPNRSTLRGDPCIIAANATGRDAVHVNGGDHGTISGLYIEDAGRDFLNFTPSTSSNWFENWRVESIRNAYTIALSANARDAYHFEIPTGLTNVYMNKFILFGDNIRGYKGNALHFVINNSCTGCAYDNWTIIDQETDSVGHASATTNPAVFFDKTSGVTNPFNSFVFVGGSFEDTGLTPTGRIFSASTNTSTLNGLIVEGSVNGNFPGFFDSSFFTNVSNVEQFDQGGHIIFQTLQWWKDNAPSQAAGIGMICPGGALGNDLLGCIFNSGAWSQRWRTIAGGGFAFDNTSSSDVASVDNNGNIQAKGLAASVGTVSMAYTLTCNDEWLNVTGTTTITVPHALTCGAISQRPRWTVFNSGSNTVTIQADSGNINGGASVTRAANTGFEVTCDGTNCFAR